MADRTLVPALLFCLFVAGLAAWWDGTVRVGLRVDDQAPVQTFNIGWSHDNVVQGFDRADPYAQGDLLAVATAANRLSITGALEPGYLAVASAGAAFLGAVALRIDPNHYVLAMVAATALAWGLALWLVFVATRPKEPAYALVLALFIGGLFLLPALRSFAFGFGALDGTSLGAALWLAALAALVWAVADYSPPPFALFGVLVAAATLSSVGLAVAGNLLLIAVPLCVAMVLALGSLGNSHHRFRLPLVAKAAVVAFIAFQVALLPWRLFAHNKLGSVAVEQADLRARHAPLWKRDRELGPEPPKTVNTPCKVDPDRCSKIFRMPERFDGADLAKEAGLAFVGQPLEYASGKAAGAALLWFGRGGPILTKRPHYAFEGALLLLFGVLGGLLAFATAVRKPTAATLTFFASVLAFTTANVLVFGLSRLDWSLSLPLRVFVYFLPLFAVTVDRFALGRKAVIEHDRRAIPIHKR